MRSMFVAASMAGALALGACASGGRGAGSNGDPEPAQFLLSADALLFVGFDANDDFRVSMDEIETGVAASFAQADTNHDGVMQPVEFSAWSSDALGGVQLPPYRLDFDRNVDNDITAEEFAVELRARAKEYDRDEDGLILRGEMLRPAPGSRALRPRGAPPGPNGAPPERQPRR